MITERRRHLLPFALVACVILTSNAVLNSACRPTPPTIVTPQGQVAYQVEDALDAIAVIQHAAINARRANLIPTATMRPIVVATIAAAKTLSSAVDAGTGTAAAYADARTALTHALAAIPAADRPRFAPHFAAADAILAVLAGGTR